jgi:hypothetical protein
MSNVIKKKPVLVFLLFLIPALFLSAQQSFFIAPGTEIRSGEVTRGYCLERTQDPLTTENIKNLTNLIGNVVFTYTDDSKVEKSFAEFYRDSSLSFTGFDSASFIKMSFDPDPSIRQITVGDDGIIMARQDADITFIKNNVNTIMAARRVGASAWEAQNTSWQSEWKPVPVLDKERNVIVFDNRWLTGTKAGEEAFMEFTGGAGVNQRYHNGRYNSFDTVKFALTGEGIGFFTHIDDDHLSGRELEQAQKEGLQGALYVPMFLRDKSYGKQPL